jgi:hypothetical protein
LKSVLTKEILKPNIEEQLKVINQQLSEFKNSKPSVALTESKMEKSLKDMFMIRDFTGQAQFEEEKKDEEGFSWAIVKGIEQKLDGSTTHTMMPMELKNSFDLYSKSLQDKYESQELLKIETLNDLTKFMKGLLMLKIDGIWHRARIHTYSKTTGLTAFDIIDTGHQVIVKLEDSKVEIKVPLVSELQKPAYSIKVLFENVYSHDIRTGDLIKLRLTSNSDFGRCTAEVKLSSIVEKEKPAMRKLLPTMLKSKILTIDDLLLKEMHVGDDIDVEYLDGCQLEQGKIHVCENRPENWKFYQDLAKSIDEYIRDNPSGRGYIPL